ncbi:MAG: glycosyl transferase UDP-glucuronosyltransferase [Rhodocyclaceae bacterium]|nr:glycosyl transferase UDP-glucuronosyltransferase [Rhodocyclaceae bacterium]
MTNPASPAESVSSAGRRRILLFGEGATLAHVARPLAVCQQLSGHGFDMTLACPEPFRWAVDEALCAWRALESQSAQVFAKRLERGAPLYDFATLLRYVEADEALIADCAPDLVIGDFRLSLAVSARRAGVPYLAIGDAYWCEEALWPPPLPVMPGLAWLPFPVRQWGFDLAAPLAFRLHARPMERLRRHFGMPGIGGSLSAVYQDADRNLFANFPALFPKIAQRRPDDFIGPLSWQMPVPLPDWAGALPPPESCVFVTMGSSGAAELLPRIIEAIVACGRTAVIATAGRVSISSDPARGVFAADYLPGRWACEASGFVVCNGGSPTSQLALAAGRPVLGICQNMDQFLNMRAIQEAGYGLSMRAEPAALKDIGRVLAFAIDDAAYRERAGRLGETGEMDSCGRLLGAIRALCQRRSQACVEPGRSTG